jgi:pimeloyl-ACP methyl ester carboxylesterase
VDIPIELQPKTTIGARGTPIACDVSGHGPLLILMHGGGMDRHMWAEQMAALDEDFTVVAFDLRGHGESGKPEQPEEYSAAHYVEDVHRVADAAGAKRFSMWGFSLGATIALQVAAQSLRVDRTVVTGSYFGKIFTEEILRPSIERASTPALRAWLTAALEWPAVEPSQLKCPTFLYAGSENRVSATLKQQAADMHKAHVQWRILPGLDHPQEVSNMVVVMPLVTSFLKTGQLPSS